MKGYARSVWTKQSGYKQMKELMELKKDLLESLEMYDGGLLENFEEYSDGSIEAAINEIANGSVNDYYDDLKKWLSDNVGNFEDYINEYGYNSKRTLFENIRAAQFVTSEREMYNNLELGIQLYIVNQLIDRGYTDIPTDLYYDIDVIDTNDFNANDTFDDINEQIETWINEYHIDCSLENVKKLSDVLGYKEFRNCLDNDDIYRTIDDLNQSRESHYNENDIIGGYESYTIYCYTTIELKRGLNYVTPVDIVEKLVFEEWNDDEQMYMSCSSEYIGISEHDYPLIIDESEEN